MSYNLYILVSALIALSLRYWFRYASLVVPRQIQFPGCDLFPFNNTNTLLLVHDPSFSQRVFGIAENIVELSLTNCFSLIFC